MAGISEMAIGIATVLNSSSSPEPLPIRLIHQTLDDAVLLIASIIRECSDADIPLRKVEVPVELLQHIRAGHLPEGSYLGVAIEEARDVTNELRFYRNA